MEENLMLDAKASFVVVIPHIILLFFLIGFITIWKPLVAVLTTKIKVTNKRVEGKKGLIKTETMDSQINQITSVKVEQGLFGKLLNYGTVYINTAGGNYEFSYMQDPEEIRKTINNAINMQSGRVN